MRGRIVLLTSLLLLSYYLECSAQESGGRNFLVTDIEKLIYQSNQFQGVSKVKTLKPVTTDSVSWPEGTWGAGYFSELYSSAHPSRFLRGFMVNDSLRYWGCYPLVRHTSRMLRAHIYSKKAFPVVNNNYIIGQALTQLLSEQQDDGSFPYYKYRIAEYETYPKKSKLLGEEEYETSEALRTLSLAFQFSDRANAKSDQQPLSNLLFLQRIKRSANWLASRYNKWLSWQNNSNIPALALSSLAAAYKIAPDTSYLTAIKNISLMLIQRQQKEGTNAGLWLTGSLDFADEEFVRHDTKIWYHSVICTGLVEALEVLPEDEKHIRHELARAIVRAALHIQNFRLRSQLPSIKNYPHADSSYGTGGYAIFEFLSLLNHHMRWMNEFSSDEKDLFRKLLYRIDENLETGISDFNTLQNFYSLACYSVYNRAIASNTEVFVWKYKKPLVASVKYIPFVPAFESPGTIGDESDSQATVFDPGSNERNYDFVVYPNPTADRLFIEGEEASTISISDTNGRVYFRQTFNSATLLSVDMRTYPTGTYLVFFQSHDRMVYKKILRN